MNIGNLKRHAKSYLERRIKFLLSLIQLKIMSKENKESTKRFSKKDYEKMAKLDKKWN